jgi:UDP-N-acetylglucosamine--dolichyl-phosphate N-acetylglucosaminephosphotransferase
MDWPLLSVIVTASFVSSLALTRLLMGVNRRLGIVGVDVHKMDKPEVPEMCGASISITLPLFATLLLIFELASVKYVLAFSLTVAMASLVGLVDDLKKPKGIFKPLAALAAGIPIVLLHTYDPYLSVPIFRGLYLPLIYPLVVPIAISVTTNTVNMLDPFNGTMAGSASLVSAVCFLSALAMGRELAAIYSALLLASLLGFLYYNRYPSRAFSGNVGSLAVGSALGLIAIQGGMEFVVLVAMFPYIQNSFYFLSEVGKFAEGREIGERPTVVLGNGSIGASKERGAPLTLARMVLADGASTEREAIKRILAVFLFSDLMAVATAYLMVV